MFVWDKGKAESNFRKHGILFEDAIQVFKDPLSKIHPDRMVDGEERKHIIGTTENCLLLLVVHAYRAFADTEVIRIISARRATRHERRKYGNG